ncbi:hypothetical protein Y032_0265g638 [Ancylostoma ceylanicum]|uniref:Uncharacterized protein n=1 Tax=Ancylostoma ceylanicum TaxID=53326 RepID=A0A016S9D9_9BILA|nr:hypothetical protein Y032_0265g638 [Ancylostoma ceylanicum]
MFSRSVATSTSSSPESETHRSNLDLLLPYLLLKLLMLIKLLTHTSFIHHHCRISHYRFLPQVLGFWLLVLLFVVYVLLSTRYSVCILLRR